MSNAGAPAALDIDPDGAGLLVRRHLAGHLDDVIEDLALLVTTETPSSSPALLGRGVDVLVGWLGVRWPGARVERIVGDAAAAGSPEAATVLRADLPGSLPGTVVLLGHHDTVFDAGTTGQRPFAVAAERASAAGTCASRAGRACST